MPVASRTAHGETAHGGAALGETVPGETVLDRLTSTDVAAAAARGALLAVPVGATEQHGPHLPLGTDTDVATALCARLAAARDDVVVAPALAYGSSGEHAGFAGTLSIGAAAVELVVLELGRSAAETFDRVLFVSAHGGNAEAVGRAVRRLRAESRDVSLYLPRYAGDAHAGHAETSMQLALHPDHVDMSAAVAGNLQPLTDLLPALRRHGVARVSPTGVLGDPTGATAADGQQLLAALTHQLLAHVAAWVPAPVTGAAS